MIRMLMVEAQYMLYTLTCPFTREFFRLKKCECSKTFLKPHIKYAFDTMSRKQFSQKLKPIIKTKRNNN